MKKLMAILAALLLVPTMAFADTWYTYTAGQEVNFYTHKDDETGKTSIILSDEGGESQYAKAWFVGIQGTAMYEYYDVNLHEEGTDSTVLENTDIYKELSSLVNDNVFGFADHAKDISEKGNLGLITLEELKTVFEAKADGENYTIDVEKYGSVFEKIVTSKTQIATSTVEGDNVWVVEMTRDADLKVTALTVKKVPVTTTGLVMVPVVYVDKTYDCTEREIKNTYACYQCGEEYSWAKIGEQADECKLVENVTTKSKCVKSPKTGIEEYILEFVAVAGVCGVALVIAKRKDLFRSI